MKKRILTLLLSILTIVLAACGNNKKENSLVFYNWGGTMHQEILDEFTKETGIKVTLAEFDENEKLYTQIKNDKKAYDLIVPSEYMLSKMISEGMLEELELDKIDNFKYINPAFKNKEFDPGNKYSIPMYYGTLGILYNKTKVDPADMDGWNAIFNKKYEKQIWMLDSSRDTLGPGFWHLGYSSNSRNKKELEEVKKLMIEQGKLVNGYLQDEIKTHMINNNGALAVTYSGKAAEAMESNKDLAWYLPKNANLWIDNFAIVKGSDKKEEAQKLINFLTRPEISSRLANLQGSPSEEGKKHEPLKTLSNNPVNYPDPKTLENQEVYKDLGDFYSTFEQAWEDVKASQN